MTYTPLQQQALDAAANLADRDCPFSQEQVRRVAVALMRAKAEGCLLCGYKYWEEDLRMQADALEATEDD